MWEDRLYQHFPNCRLPGIIESINLKHSTIFDAFQASILKATSVGVSKPDLFL